jgi:hypothetical protein
MTRPSFPPLSRAAGSMSDRIKPPVALSLLTACWASIF